MNRQARQTVLTEIFCLCLQDSVPKFLRNAKYEQQLRNYDLDMSARAPERSQSRSNRK